MNHRLHPDLILPGATIGVLGDGQLGRMLAIEARRMGYRVIVYGDALDSPAAQFADAAFVVPFDIEEPWETMLRDVHVLTYETENLPLDFVKYLAQYVLVRPGLSLLEISQHRLREKQALCDAGLPTATFYPVASSTDYIAAVERFGHRCVLKTTTGGYDGKGQWLIRSVQEAASVADQLTGHLGQGSPLSPGFIMERWVDFQCEFSVVAARSAQGEFRSYGPMLNFHHDHILDLSLCPAGLGDEVNDQAIEMMRHVAEDLGVVGLFCIEFFLTKEGDVLINEIAPRTHNSGHLTMEAHVTNQFAQQVRAICGLPLGSTDQHTPAAMANLLGDLWDGGEPNWHSVLAVPTASLHLYGKKIPRPQRKMGHLTILGETAESAACLARSVRTEMGRTASPEPSRSMQGPIQGRNASFQNSSL